MEGDQSPNRRRLTVPEAADALNISVEAVRGRIKRDSLEVERTPDGKVFVLLDTDRTRPQTDQAQPESTALISAKDETIATLREQLEAERQAHAEARRIIAGLVERIPPAIEQPPREAPQSPGERPEGYEAGEERQGREEPSSRRSWWEFWR